MPTTDPLLTLLRRCYPARARALIAEHKGSIPRDVLIAELQSLAPRYYRLDADIAEYVPDHGAIRADLSSVALILK